MTGFQQPRLNQGAEPPSTPPAEISKALQVTLSEAHSERFDRLTTPLTKAKMLAEIIAERLGVPHDFSVGKNLSPDDRPKYAEVRRIDIDRRDLVIKFRHDNSGGSNENASTELAKDNESLSRRLPGMVGYFGCVRHADESIIAVVTHYDGSPSLKDAIATGNVTMTDARTKLIGLIQTFEQNKFFLVDDNLENVRVREDGTFFVVDGAAVSRHTRFGRNEADGSDISPMLLNDSVPVDSPDAGLMMHFEALAFDGGLDAEYVHTDELPPQSGFLTAAEVADYVLSNLK